MDAQTLKKIYLGTAATTIGLGSVGMLSGAGMPIKYLLLALLCLVQFEFYRRLQKFPTK